MKKEWTPENLPSKLDDWDALASRTVERIKAEGERWAPLLSSDQIAIIVFADETGLRSAAEELHLPLAS